MSQQKKGAERSAHGERHALRCAKGSHQMNSTGFCCWCIHSRKKAKAKKCGCVGCVPAQYKGLVTRRRSIE